MSFFKRLFGKGDVSEPAEYRTLVEQSMEELRIKTQAHDQLWGLAESDWSVDQDTGTIVFNGPKGMTATCPVQIIGTFSTADDTWLWGWDHPAVQAPLQEHARRVREYGIAHGIDKLTTQKLALTQDEAWEFAALACKLCEAQGAYRGPAGTAMVFMTFGNVQLSKSPATQPK